MHYSFCLPQKKKREDFSNVHNKDDRTSFEDNDSFSTTTFTNLVSVIPKNDALLPDGVIATSVAITNENNLTNDSLLLPAITPVEKQNVSTVVNDERTPLPIAVTPIVGDENLSTVRASTGEKLS